MKGLWQNMAKKNREIRWKEAIGNINYNQNISEKSKVSIGEAILAVFCVFMFIYSARIMLEDVFKWGNYTGKNLLSSLLILILVSVIMEPAKYAGKGKERIIHWGVLVGGVICCVFYLLYKENGEHVLEGIKKIGALYGEQWNAYYNDGERNTVTDIKYIATALNFVTIVLSYVFIWFAKISRKNIVAVVLPLAVLVAELLVGFSPETVSLTLMFVAIVLSNASKWKKSDFGHAPGKKNRSAGRIRGFSWLVSCACTVIICGLINITGAALAKETVTNSEDIVAYWKAFIEEIPEWSVWDLFKKEYKDEKTAELTNDTPKYEEIEVLQLNIDKQPAGNVYLRGFYADIYDDGVWERDIDAFEAACEDAGYNPDELSKKIISLGADKAEKTFNIYTSAKLTYLEPMDTRAYVQYFTRLNNKDVSIEGDGRYVKDEELDEFSYITWLGDMDYKRLLEINGIYDSDRWELWYEDYVMENYTDVPSEMQQVKKVADNVKMILQNMPNYSSSAGRMEENKWRLSVTAAMCQWLREETEYTLYPQELPKGTDPIEYFLGTSRRGYCMHYASAATMILRELGVPARYASGYLASADSFKPTDGNYESRIKDSKAHAWVEIYLNGIGWVPVEVTNGYYASDSASDGETQIPDQEEVNRPNDDNQEENDSDDTDSTQEEPIPEGDNNGTGGIGIGGTGSGGTGSGGTVSQGGGSTLLIGISGGQGETTILFDIGKILIPVAVIVVIVIIVYIIMRLRASYRNKLLNEIRKKRTLRAIRRINRRIYRKLRLTGKVIKTDLRDEGYEKLLVKNYKSVSVEEWKRYMDIVKAAAFSIRDFSEDEMNFCHRVYCRVIKNS